MLTGWNFKQTAATVRQGADEVNHKASLQRCGRLGKPTAHSLFGKCRVARLRSLKMREQAREFGAIASLV
ncbi:hypothetical protein EEJ38_18485 [Vibrio cholerae]|nr:hypothetical protein EEJ38_18485 [Vibrio cholerae]